MSGKRKNYKVGYKMPPTNGRFKPGQSGNPSGRPKGLRNFKTDLLGILKSSIAISEGGHKGNVSTQLATLLRLREKALNGDIRAVDKLIELMIRYNDHPIDERNGRNIDEDDRKIIEALFAREESIVEKTPGTRRTRRTRKRLQT